MHKTLSLVSSLPDAIHEGAVTGCVPHKVWIRPYDSCVLELRGENSTPSFTGAVVAQVELMLREYCKVDDTLPSSTAIVITRPPLVLADGPGHPQRHGGQ